MYINKKTKLIFTIITALATLTFLSMLNCAAVDFTGGVNEVADQFKSQAETIATIIFGCIAIIAFTFTIIKGIAAGISYHRGQDFSVGPIIGGAVATIVCGLASSSAFFGWFGL